MNKSLQILNFVTLLKSVVIAIMHSINFLVKNQFHYNDIIVELTNEPGCMAKTSVILMD